MNGTTEQVAAIVTRQQAVEAVSEVLEARESSWGTITAGTRFDEIAIDSVEVAELFMVLEEIVGVRLDPTPAVDFVVVADLTRLRPLAAPANV